MTQGSWMIPGVLLHVTRQWSQGVLWSVRFEVGFRACMMGGAFEMCGIVHIGVSSITLCSAMCWSPSVALCCIAGGGRERILSIHVARSLSSRLPLGVPLASSVVSVSSLVNAQKC